MRLDHLDAKIVSLLQRDARLSYREIAHELGSTTPTVSARVKALEDIGLLRGYRAQLDHAVLGGTSYVLSLTAQPSSSEGIFVALRTMPGVESVRLLAGGRMVAHVHLRPPTYALSHLHQAIARLPGVVGYDASEVIVAHERAEVEELPENVEVPCHQCKGPIHGDPVKGKFGERTHVFCCRHCLATFRDRFQDLQAAAAPRRRPKARPAPSIR